MSKKTTPNTKKTVNSPPIPTTGKPSFICDICNRQFKTVQGLRGHERMVHSKKSTKTPTTSLTPLSKAQMDELDDLMFLGLEIDESILLPPDVEFYRLIFSDLQKRLPTVMGLGDNSTSIILETIKDDPKILLDLVAVQYHIMSLFPKVNGYHLQWVLNYIYQEHQDHLHLLQRLAQLPPPLYWL